MAGVTESYGGATFYAGRDGSSGRGPSAQSADPSATRRGVLFRMNNRWRGCLIEIVETVLLTAIIFFVVQHFVAQPYQIIGISMENTLSGDQMVLVDKISPVFTDYRRGDVIVFSPPTGHLEDGKDVPFIKRVIGVPGDVVDVRGGSVYVNGVKLSEPYTFTDDGSGTQAHAAGPMDQSGINGGACTSTDNEVKCRVPAGDLFVMGDHRNESTDSRVFGPIAKSTVIGRAWLRYWPLSRLSWVTPAEYSDIPSPAPSPPPSPSK